MTPGVEPSNDSSLPQSPSGPAGQATNPDAAAPPVLGYGHAPARVRRWARRLLFLAWVAGTLWLAYDKWGVLVRLQVVFVYQQQRCLRYAASTDRVVLELDRSRVPSLLTQAGYRSGRLNFFHTGAASVAAVYDPPGCPWSDYGEAATLHREYERLRNPPPADESIPDFSDAPDVMRPDAADALARSYPVLLSGPEPDDSVIVFLHGRRAADGPTRLVRIVGDWYSEEKSVVLWADVTATRYTGVDTGDSPVRYAYPRPVHRVSVRSPDGSAGVRLFAGQFDPADESRLTIRYDTAAGAGTIVGRLGVDDEVTFDFTDGPLAPPTTPAEVPQ